MTQPNKLTWVRGEKTYGIDMINSNSEDWYKSRLCHGCGSSDSNKSCKVSYYVGNPNGRNEKYDKYDWSPLSPGDCGGSNDNIYKIYCLDYNICPNLANIQAQPQWGNYERLPQKSANRPNSGEKTAVDCLYPLSMFTDEETVIAFRDAFGITSDYNDVILPFFCSSQNINNPRGTQCPKDPFKANQVNMETCSNMISNKLCKDWSRNASSSLTDNAKYDYCDSFNTPDCLCINRNDNPLYISIAPSTLTAPACWWTPCKEPDQYLVPSDTKCEDSGCSSVSVILAQDSSGLMVETSQFISCTTNDNLSPNGDISGKISTIWSKYWWIILIVTIIIALIIIVLIVVL